jgi:hypothetical protein
VAELREALSGRDATIASLQARLGSHPEAEAGAAAPGANGADAGEGGPRAQDQQGPGPEPGLAKAQRRSRAGLLGGVGVGAMPLLPAGPAGRKVPARGVFALYYLAMQSSMDRMLAPGYHHQQQPQALHPYLQQQQQPPLGAPQAPGYPQQQAPPPPGLPAAAGGYGYRF